MQASGMNGPLLKMPLFNVGAARATTVTLRGDLLARIGRRSEIGSHLPVFMLRDAAVRAMRGSLENTILEGRTP